MQSQLNSVTTSFYSASFLVVAVLLTSSSLLSQEANRGWPKCDLSGSWYGGGSATYHMTVTPARQLGHYIVSFEGMYKNSVLNTLFNGELVKKGNRYEGSGMSLFTTDPAFLNPPPIGKMPDIVAGWMFMEMTDCNTVKNTFPFLGMYFAGNVWQPGITWVTPGKVPLIDAPDVDLLDILTGGKPIVETYHRLLNTVNPNLLHHN